MTDIALKNDNYELMEKVIAEGDLSKLTAQERLMYYNKTCESLGLNPLTRPFEYIRLSGKLTLYARKDATEQLRKINKISITKLETTIIEGVYIVTAYARSVSGQEDVGTGAVTIKGLAGDALANAFLKAETKAKRRVTLSICGLGLTDETEVDSIPNSRHVNVNHETGEVEEVKKLESIKSGLDLQQEMNNDLELMTKCESVDMLKDLFKSLVSKYKTNKEYVEQLIFVKDTVKAELENKENE